MVPGRAVSLNTVQFYILHGPTSHDHHIEREIIISALRMPFFPPNVQSFLISMKSRFHSRCLDERKPPLSCCYCQPSAALQETPLPLLLGSTKGLSFCRFSIFNFGQVSCTPGWPRIFIVAEDGLELDPASTSQLQDLQVCTSATASARDQIQDFVHAGQHSTNYAVSMCVCTYVHV